MPRIYIESPSFAFAIVLIEMRNQYTQAYYTTNDKRAGARPGYRLFPQYFNKNRKKARDRGLGDR